MQVAVKQMFLYHHRKSVKRLLQEIRYEFWPVQSFENQFPQIWFMMTFAKYFVIVYGAMSVIVTQVWVFLPYVEPLPGYRKMPILCW